MITNSLQRWRRTGEITGLDPAVPQLSTKAAADIRRPSRPAQASAGTRTHPPAVKPGGCAGATQAVRRNPRTARYTNRNQKESVMIVLALIVLAVAIVLARLVTDIRQDRPLTPPRSHFHELDRPTRLPTFS
jgi:hypothetical protein